MIKYSDKYFDEKSSRYNKNLAELSAHLMLLSHDKTALSSFFEKNKFEYSFKNFRTTKKPSFSVGFAIGWKRSKRKGNICIISVRGTVKGEWYSNFDLFDRNTVDYHKHFGFFNAANDVINECDKLFSDKENVVFLVTGHSRGGAVSNIVSRVLSQEKEYTSKDNVFGYTLASPNVSNDADETMDNIYNFINKDDIITAIPLNLEGTLWSYKRNGLTISMDINGSDDRFNKKIIKYYEQLTGEKFVSIDEGDTEEVIETVTDLSPGPKDYYTRKSVAYQKRMISVYDYFNYGILKILSGNSSLSGGFFLVKTQNGAFSKVTEYLMKYASGEFGENKENANGIECNHSRELYFAFVKAYNKFL